MATHSEVVGSDGYYSLSCGEPDEWFASAMLIDANVDGGEYVGTWVACGDTIDVMIRTGAYDAFNDLQVVVPTVTSALGYSLGGAARFSVTSHGCSGTGGDSLNAVSCYDASANLIRLTTAAATFVPWVGAHEYGHKLHEVSLGGLWPNSCPTPHYVDSLSTYGCAMQEGFADYVGNVGGAVLSSLPFGSWESHHQSTPGDEGEIESNVAALFQDLIDSNNEGDDNTTYSGYYVATVFKTCTTSYYGINYERRAVDQFVWCLENRFDGSVHASNFPNRYTQWPYRSSYTAQSESATEPGSWDADDIRSTWLQNVGG